MVKKQDFEAQIQAVSLSTREQITFIKTFQKMLTQDLTDNI